MVNICSFLSIFFWMKHQHHITTRHWRLKWLWYWFVNQKWLRNWTALGIEQIRVVTRTCSQAPQPAWRHGVLSNRILKKCHERVKVDRTQTMRGSLFPFFQKKQLAETMRRSYFSLLPLLFDPSQDLGWGWLSKKEVEIGTTSCSWQRQTGSTHTALPPPTQLMRLVNRGTTHCSSSHPSWENFRMQVNLVVVSFGRSRCVLTPDGWLKLTWASTKNDICHYILMRSIFGMFILGTVGTGELKWIKHPNTKLT